MRPLDPRLLPLLRPASPSLTGVVAAQVVGGGLLVAQAFAVAHLLVVVARGQVDRVPLAAALTVLVVAARSLASYVADRCAARASSTVTSHLRHRLAESVLGLPADRLSQQRGGELGLLVTRGVSAVDPYLTRYLPALVVAVVLPPLTLVAIGSQDLLSAAIVVATLPLVPVFAVLVGLATRDRAEQQWQSLGSLAGHFVDVVRGLPTLVVHRRARAQSATIRRVTDEHRRATLDTLRLAFASSAVLELVATLSVALVAVTVGVRLAGGSLDLGTALVVLLLAPEAYWPLRRVGAEFHAAAEGTATLTAAQDLFDAVPGAADPTGEAAPWTGLTLHDLRVVRPARSTPALDLPGETVLPARGLVAVTGPSGCGKSTLLAVLAGELAPATGTDRRQVAWVPQRPWLEGATVRDLLVVARPDAPDADLWAALARVDLDHLVAGLPDGLDAPVGEDGDRFSGGQRARLALARAVLARRPLVLVDEPSAHLDPASERVVVDTLTWLAQTSTVVAVTHSPRLVGAADRVLRLRPAAPVPSAAEPAPPAPARAAPVPARSRPVPGEQSPARRTSGAGRWRRSVLLGVAASSCGVALTVTSGWLITRASEHPPLLFLMVAIVGVRAFGIGRPLLRYAERLVGHDSALRMLAERRAEVYDTVVPLTPGALGRRRGDLLAGVVDDVDALLDDRLRVRSPLLQLVGVGALAAVLGWALLPVTGALVLALVAVTLLVAALVRGSVGRAERALVTERAALSTAVVAVVQGARDLVLWQAGDRALDRVDAVGAALASAVRRSADRVALGRSAVLVAAGLTTAALAGAAAPAVAEGRLPAATAAALVLLPLALLDVLLVAPDAAATSVRTRAATDRLAALAGTSPAVTSPASPVSVTPAPEGMVTHRLSGGWGAPVFAGLDLEVVPGTRVGVVGPSGSGKSTLAATLVRFVDPQQGGAAIGGTDLRELDLDDVHRLVGLVDDDPHVFSSTVAENVRLARPGCADAEVEQVLRQVSLGPWLDALPDGLHTMVGDGHAAVSGGERARLGLARALLADHPVLVLDEPTAHLDASTAHDVARDVLRATEGRSVVWVTHDAVALDAMDRVVDLATYAVP